MNLVPFYRMTTERRTRGRSCPSCPIIYSLSTIFASCLLLITSKKVTKKTFYASTTIGPEAYH
jgi:hypothetical protein